LTKKSAGINSSHKWISIPQTPKKSTKTTIFSFTWTDGFMDISFFVLVWSLVKESFLKNKVNESIYGSKEFCSLRAADSWSSADDRQRLSGCGKARRDVGVLARNGDGSLAGGVVVVTLLLG
jgi:hypothetical protein